MYERCDTLKRKIGYVRLGSLADKVTSPRHVRFTPNNGRWTAHPSQHFGRCAFMSTRPIVIRGSYASYAPQGRVPGTEWRSLPHGGPGR